MQEERKIESFWERIFQFYLEKKKKKIPVHPDISISTEQMIDRSIIVSVILFLPRSRKVGTRHKMAGRREQVSKLVPPPSPFPRPTPAGAFYSPKYLRRERRSVHREPVPRNRYGRTDFSFVHFPRMIDFKQKRVEDTCIIPLTVHLLSNNVLRNIL